MHFFCRLGREEKGMFGYSGKKSSGCFLINTKD